MTHNALPHSWETVDITRTSNKPVSGCKHKSILFYFTNSLNFTYLEKFPPCRLECLLCSKYMTNINWFNLHHPKKSSLLLLPIYRWWNWSTDRLSNWPKINTAGKWTIWDSVPDSPLVPKSNSFNHHIMLPFNVKSPLQPMLSRDSANTHTGNWMLPLTSLTPLHQK